MKHTLSLAITFVYLVLPYLVPFTAFSAEVQVCERVQGCPTFNSARTLREYCPTCVFKTITPRVQKVTNVTYVTNVNKIRRVTYRSWLANKYRKMSLKLTDAIEELERKRLERLQ